LPREQVYTPGCHTIAEVAAFLGVPESRTAKAVFLVSDDRFFFVIVRGDMDVDEDKLAQLVGVRDLRPALEYEITALGASPGYAAPIDIRREAPDAGLRQVLIVVDDLVPQCPNLVTGANKEDYHMRNVNYGRDYTADLVGDLVSVEAGDPCPHCSEPFDLFQTTVLGRTWVPGAQYSEALEASFQDDEGEGHPLILSCAEVEVDRLVAACVEVGHDEGGILWPAKLAPYIVYLLSLGNDPEVAGAADALYQVLRSQGITVLYDDRDERAGVKFTDADLLGMPLRVAISRRTLKQQSAEVKRRDQPRESVRVIPLEDVTAWVREQSKEV
jgi:prolyl-tRNA synthetase